MGLTAAEEKELNALRAQEDISATAPGLSPEEQEELAQLHAAEASDSPVDSPAKAGPETTFEKIMRNLNRIGGTSRLLIKNATEHGVRAGDPYDMGSSVLDPTVDSAQERAAKGAAGPGPELPPGALRAALQGRGKSSAELYPGIGPVAGFVGDMATDPSPEIFGSALRTGLYGLGRGALAVEKMTAPAVPSVANPGSPLNQAARAVARRLVAPGVNAPGAVAEAAERPISRIMFMGGGRKMYGAAVAPMEAAAPGVTDVMFDAGIKGTRNTIGKNITKHIDKLDAENKLIAMQASNRLPNTPIQPQNVASEMWTEARRLHAAPVNRNAVNAQINMIDGYVMMPPQSVNEALLQQAELRAAAKEAYRVGGEGATVRAQISRAGNQGYASELQRAMEAGPSDIQPLAGKFRGNNQAMGKLINAEGAANSLRTSTPLVRLSDITSGLAGGFYTGNPMIGVATGVGTRALKEFGLTGLGTYGGRALYRLGQTGLAEPALLQGAIHAASPWALIPEEETKK